jgi:hypothetical protein
LRENLYNITPLLQRIWEIQNDKQLSETAKNNSINKAIEQSLQSVGVNTSGMNFAGLH